MNWKGRLAWNLLDSLWAIRLRGVSRRLAQFADLDPEMAGCSWHGTAITAARVVQTVRAAGGTVLDMSAENTAMAWCSALKSEAGSENPTQL